MPTITHREPLPDNQYADILHEPNPEREAERARLGLLGRLASVLCLLQIYRHAPDEDEVLACVGNLIAFRRKRVGEARAKKETPARPFLWILAAARPDAVLAGLGSGAAPGWPPGST